MNSIIPNGYGFLTHAKRMLVRAAARAGRIEQATIIHMPLIGCGLAGGNWEQIEPMALRSFTRAFV